MAGEKAYFNPHFQDTVTGVWYRLTAVNGVPTLTAEDAGASVTYPAGVPNIYSVYDSVAEAQRRGISVLQTAALDEWHDMIPSARTLAQASSGARPLLRYQGARWEVLFDGSNDQMKVDFTALTQPITIIAALRWISIPAGYRWVSSKFGASGAAAEFGLADDERSTMFAGGGDELKSATTQTAGASYIHVCRFNGSSSTHKRNETLTSGTVGTDGLAGLTLGARHDGTSFAPVALHHFAIIDGTMSDADRVVYIDWLNARYALGVGV